MGRSSFERNLEARRTRDGSRTVVTDTWALVAGVGILWSKRWKRKIMKTEHVSERVITTTMKCHQRGQCLLPQSGYKDGHTEKMYKCIENHSNKNILRSSRAISRLSLDLVMILNVTTLESMQ